MARLIKLPALLSVFFLFTTLSEVYAQRVRGGFRGGPVGGRVYSRPVYQYTPRYWGSYARPYAGFGYRPFFAPSIGLGFGYLPYGYSPFYWGSNLYYYNNGVFLQPFNNGSYRVVNAPLGAEIKRLPSQSNKITIKDEVYYEKDGTLYLPVTNADGKKMYRIVGKNGTLASQEEIDRSLNGRDNNSGDNNNRPNSNDDVYRDEQNADDTNNNALPWVGDVVDELPQGTKTLTLHDKTYFVSPADVYYEKTKEYGKDRYRVIRTPASESSGKG